MAFTINFPDADSGGNPCGAFSNKVLVQGMDPKRFVSGTLDLAVYVAGGFDVSKIVGLFDNIDGIYVNPASGYIFEFDKTNQKLKAFLPAASHDHGDTDGPSATASLIANSAIAFPGIVAPTVSATKYLGMDGSEGATAAAVVPFIVPPIGGGRITGIRCNLGTAPGAGKTYTLTVVKNGVDTGMTVSITEAATYGSDTTAGHIITVAAGDQIVLKSVNDDGVAAIVAASLLYEIEVGTGLTPTTTHVHTTNVAGSSGVAVEVGAGVDLSAIVDVQFFAWGR